MGGIRGEKIAHTRPRDRKKQKSNTPRCAAPPQLIPYLYNTVESRIAPLTPAFIPDPTKRRTKKEQKRMQPQQGPPDPALQALRLRRLSALYDRSMAALEVLVPLALGKKQVADAVAASTTTGRDDAAGLREGGARRDARGEEAGEEKEASPLAALRLGERERERDKA